MIKIGKNGKGTSENERKMSVNAALLGLGTVGTGVYKDDQKPGAGNDSQAWMPGKDHKDPGA